jgi:hypothetical protein
MMMMTTNGNFVLTEENHTLTSRISHLKTPYIMFLARETLCIERNAFLPVDGSGNICRTRFYETQPGE